MSHPPVLEPVVRQAYRIMEVVAMYGLSRSHVYDLIYEGELSPILRSGRAVRIPVTTLEAWLARNQAVS